MNTLETMIAAATAHRACCGSEHDLLNGKLHGYCVVCGVQWPCETAKTFIFTSQPPYPYLAVCQDLAQILQAPLPSDGGPGDLGDLVEAIRNRMARLEDRAACLQATLEENRQLKDQLIEAQDLQHAAQDAAGKAQAEVATLQQHVQALGAPVYRAVEAERERLCRKFTSGSYMIRMFCPSSTETVGLTFETALAAAVPCLIPRKESTDAHPSF